MQHESSDFSWIIVNLGTTEASVDERTVNVRRSLAIWKIKIYQIFFVLRQLCFYIFLSCPYDERNRKIRESSPTVLTVLKQCTILQIKELWACFQIMEY